MADTKKKIKKVLIANRGEIALRILRTVKELSMDSVVIYEKPDSEAYYIRLADDAIMIGDGPRKDYLDIDKIIWAARKSGADAIHPGYGFLSEIPEFSAECARAGIVFIGPPPDVIRNLGNKVVARDIIEKANLPFIPGTKDLFRGDAGLREAIAFGRRYGYPVMLKASSGGGGRGIRKVINEADLEIQLPQARAEALSAFGDENVYVENCIEAPRHVEYRSLPTLTVMSFTGLAGLFHPETSSETLEIARQIFTLTCSMPCTEPLSKQPESRDMSMPERSSFLSIPERMNSGSWR
jgi:acetyl/propionyl-CoA carboxylase alpha subunit